MGGWRPASLRLPVGRQAFHADAVRRCAGRIANGRPKPNEKKSPMADYYPLLSGVMADLENSSAELRRRLYESIRNGFVEQMRKHDPPWQIRRIPAPTIPTIPLNNKEHADG